nr:TPA_asm: PLA2X [Megastigmus wasp adintovirus]
MIVHEGHGLINKLINNLPFEMHIPGYQYCGPGTNLYKRLARGDPGINPLDAACKEHDIAYSKNREDVSARNTADRVLAEKAWQRVKANDSNFGEKAAAYAVTNIMKMKSKFGMGLKNKKSKKRKMMTLKKKLRKMLTLKKLIKNTSKLSVPSNDSRVAIKKVLQAARTSVKKAGGKRNITLPRIIPVPKVGGFLPALIPVFAGLSAVGSLAGGAAGIAQAVNRASAAKRQLEEQQRHNQKMEAMALGKGLYLKPHQKGFGIILEKKKNVKVAKKKVRR